MSWYKMHRGWMDNELFDNEPYTQREAWEWLISSANYQAKTTNIQGQPFKLEVGQLSHSIRFMAEKWQWSKSRTSRYLAKLRDWRMIEIRDSSGTAQNIITICNYSKYQDTRDSDVSKSGTAAGQQRDKDKEGKKERKKEYTPLPPTEKQNDFEDFWKNWTPVDMAKGNKKLARASYEKAIKKGITHETINTGSRNYCDYCKQSGARTQHVSTWLNNDGWEFEAPNPNTANNRIPKPSYSHQVNDAAELAKQSLRIRNGGRSASENRNAAFDGAGIGTSEGTHEASQHRPDYLPPPTLSDA